MKRPEVTILDPGAPRTTVPDAVLRCLVWTRREGPAWIVAWQCCACSKMHAVDHRAPVGRCECGHALCVAPRGEPSPLVELGTGLGRGIIRELARGRERPSKRGRR